jgi:hypothetical protein
VSGQHEILVAVVVQIGESESARPPVGLGEGRVYGEPVGDIDRELVRLERSARVTLLDKGIVVGEGPEEEIEVPVVIDIALGYPVSPPVFGHLVGDPLLVGHVGEGDVRRARGRRRSPASCLIDVYRTPINTTSLR